MKYNSNKKALILGASSDIGLKLIEIYLKNQYKIIAHYNKGNKFFFKLVDSNKNKIKKIKFNFLTNLNQSEKFLKNKIFKDCSVLINALGYLKETNYSVLKLNDLENALKVNLFPGIYLTQKIGEEMNKMLYLAKSRAEDLVKPIKPNFVVEYRDLPLLLTTPNIDEILIILPNFLFIIFLEI